MRPARKRPCHIPTNDSIPPTGSSPARPRVLLISVIFNKEAAASVVERIHPLAVMESDAANGRVFNVGTGRPTTILRFAELLRAAYEAKVAPYAKPVFHLYVAQVPDRKKQEAAFDAANISHGIHYPIPVYLQPAFADLGYKAGSFPVAEALAPKIISLPMYPELKDSQIGHVTGACLKS